MGSKQSTPQVPTVKEEEAIEDIHREIDRLTKTINYKTILIKKEDARIEECVNRKDKLGASTHLQSKIRLQQSISSITRMISNLEAQLSAIQTAKSNIGVMNAIRKANEVMKGLTLSADRVDTVMEEARDRINDVNEIVSILSQPVEEQVDVEDELNRLEAYMNSPEPVYHLPNVPTEVPTNAELRQLVEA